MTDKLNEPKWKNDLVKRIWKYAREKCPKCGSDDVGELDDGKRFYCVFCGYILGRGHLTEGLGDLITAIRTSCDRCGISRKKAYDSEKDRICHYQCCWVKTEDEDYCPSLCINCHQELQKQRPHAVISV